MPDRAPPRLSARKRGSRRRRARRAVLRSASIRLASRPRAPCRPASLARTVDLDNGKRASNRRELAIPDHPEGFRGATASLAVMLLVRSA